MFLIPRWICFVPRLIYFLGGKRVTTSGTAGFRALSGRLTFTVRRHKFDEAGSAGDPLCFEIPDVFNPQIFKSGVAVFVGVRSSIFLGVATVKET